MDQEKKNGLCYLFLPFEIWDFSLWPEIDTQNL